MKSKFHYWQCIKKLEFFSETKVIFLGITRKLRKEEKKTYFFSCVAVHIYMVSEKITISTADPSV